jgi:hypothetical protein
MTVKLLTIAEYARHRQCDERAVRRALAECRITRLSTERLCIDPEVADIQWAKNTRSRVRPSHAGLSAQAGSAVHGIADARDRKSRAEADMAELESRRRAGKLMQVEPAERAVFACFRELRDANFAAVRSAAPSVAGLTDVREVQHLLEDALRGGFDHFEQRMRSQLAAQLAAQQGG